MRIRNTGWICLAALAVACSAARPVRAGRGVVSTANTAAAAPRQKRGQGVTLAVLPFKNNTGEVKFADLGETLAESASLGLASVPEAVLVERQRITEILSELKLQKTDAIDQETAVRIGRLLGAQLMAFGSFAALGDTTLLTARVVSVETGEILGAAAERGGGPAEFEQMAGKGVKTAVGAALKNFKQAAARPGSDVAAEPDGDFPKARTSAPNAIGVVIGVRDYRNKDVPAADYALNDARLMKRYLVRTLGYLPDNIIYLENPTKTELETVLGSEKEPRGKIARYIGKRDPKDVDLFVYYSGHGAPGLKNGQAFFIPADANPDYLEVSGYSRDLMLANLAALGARSTTVVLEACFSGKFDGGAIIRNASPLVLTVKEGGSPRNINLLTSSAGNQISSWYPEKRQSLFTYQFAQAIRDSASKPAALKAGALIKLLERRVSEQAERRYNRSQTPQFSGNPDQIMAGQ
jgi:TolB-like protein